MILDIIKCFILLVANFLVIAMLWRSKNLELTQKEFIYKILLDINDRNCQTCSTYYKKVLASLIRIDNYVKNRQNTADLITKSLVDESKL